MLRTSVVSTVLVTVLSACASINRETHYIKSVDGFGFPVNYYRVSVRGSTTLSSSRYLSGYFPDDAVDIYFGQIPQSADGRFIPVKATTDGANGDATSKASAGTSAGNTSVGAAPNTKLVLLLSSRAEAVATEISDIARNEELMRNITKLLSRDELEAARRAGVAQQASRARFDALLSIGTSSIQDLENNADAATATANLLLFCNQVAFQFGNRVPFTSLQQAGKWYEHNRDTLVGRSSQ